MEPDNSGLSPKYGAPLNAEITSGLPEEKKGSLEPVSNNVIKRVRVRKVLRSEALPPDESAVYARPTAVFRPGPRGAFSGPVDLATGVVKGPAWNERIKLAVPERQPVMADSAFATKHDLDEKYKALGKLIDLEGIVAPDLKLPARRVTEPVELRQEELDLAFEIAKIVCGTMLTPREIFAEVPAVHVLPAKHISSTVLSFDEIVNRDCGYPAIWPDPIHSQEFQVAGRNCFYRFHGKAAFDRLSALNPHLLAHFEIDEKVRQPLIKTTVGEQLVFRTTLMTIHRSYAGACKQKDFKVFIRNFENWKDGFRLPSDYRGALVNQRFFQCIPQIHAFFTHVSTVFEQHAVELMNLRTLLVGDMIQSGELSPPTVTIFKESLEELLESPRSPMGKWLFTLPVELRATLYRSRRIFLKDVEDLNSFSTRTLNKFCSPPIKIGSFGWEKLLYFTQHELRPWVEGHKTRLQDRLRELPLHCSKASIFFTRSAGGGVSERNLVLGLFRLSQGISSPLFKPAGELKHDCSLKEVVTFVSPIQDLRDEIYQACAWWIEKVIPAIKLVRQIITILPERENKPRSFFLWDWVTQLCCMFYKEVFRLFFKEHPFCHEAFSGMRTNEITDMLKSSIGDVVASMDSTEATNNIPFPVSKEIIRCVDDIVPPFARIGAHKVFEPYPAQVAKDRPELHMGDLAAVRDFGRKLPFQVVFQDATPVRLPQRFFLGSPTGHLPDVPAARGFPRILEALRTKGRVLLKSPTGTGKTVLAAAAFRSIITFPSIAALTLFQMSCRHFNIPHNLYYSRQKGSLLEKEVGVDDEGNPILVEVEHMACDQDGVPFTILTTESFLVSLSRQFPKMLVVIDEADTFRSQTVFNCMETQRLGIPTLLMTATPERMNEPETVIIDLEGTTNFPITEESCSLKKMPSIIRKISGKCLICTYSEPHCSKIAAMLEGVPCLILNSETRRTSTAEQIADAKVIISTAVIRSSVTIPGLSHVFDLGLVYRKIDLSRNGFEQLLLFKANEAEVKQLKGRVGRTQPGTYWRVTCPGKVGLDPLPAILDRATCFSDHPESLLLGLHNRELNNLSVLLEHSSREVIGRICGRDPFLMRPQIVDLIEHFDPPEGKLLAISVLLEESMIVNLCRNSSDLEIKQLGALRQLSEGDPVRVNLALWRAIERTHFFEQERFIIRRQTEDLPEGELKSELSDQALLVIGIYWWRRLARSLSGNFCGLYRDFLANSPRTKFGGEFFLCWDLGYDNGTLQCCRAYCVDRVKKRLDDEFQGHSVTVPRIPVTYPVYNNDFVGGLGPVGGLAMVCTDRSRIYDPEELPEILDCLKKHLEDSGTGDVQMTQTGCPMSSVLSFSILNSVSLAASIGSKASSRGFGDDLIARGGESQCLAIEKSRADLGLLTKRESTGYGKVGDDAICVFTERFWSLKSLEPVHSLKPQGLVFLSRALYPKGTIGPGEFFLPDYSTTKESMTRQFPGVSRLKIYKPNSKVAYQQTPLRRMLISAFAKDASEASNLCNEEDASVLMSSLEAILLPLMPSQRASPLRVDDVKHTPLLVSISSVSSVVDTLEGFGYWTPLHLHRFRTSGETMHQRLEHEYGDEPFTGSLKDKFLSSLLADSDF